MNAIPFIFPVINITKLRNQIHNNISPFCISSNKTVQESKRGCAKNPKNQAVVRMKSNGLGHPPEDKKTRMILLIPYCKFVTKIMIELEDTRHA